MHLDNTLVDSSWTGYKKRNPRVAGGSNGNQILCTLTTFTSFELKLLYIYRCMGNRYISNRSIFHSSNQGISHALSTANRFKTNT